MTAKGHVLLALPFGLLMANSFGMENIELFVFLALVATGALFPDIDESGSYIGRRFWFLTWLIKALSVFIPAFKHRGVTHFFLIPALLMLTSVGLHNVWIGGFAIGWLMHTVGDLVTIGGINGYLYPLWPKQKIVLLPNGWRFYTGSFTEKFIIAFLMLLNGYLALSFGVFK